MTQFLITWIIDLTDLVKGLIWIGIFLAGLILWVLFSIIEDMHNERQERKRKKMHEEYDRKFGEGSEEDGRVDG